MEKQISPMVRSVFSHLQQIAQLWPYLNRKSLVTLVPMLVISRIDYFNILYAGQSLKAIEELHRCKI